MPEGFLISQNEAIAQFVLVPGRRSRRRREYGYTSAVASSSHACTSSVNKGDSVSRTRA